MNLKRSIPCVMHDQNLPTCQIPSQSVTMNGIYPELFCYLGTESII